MKIILKHLTIINFKGIERLDLAFNERETFIFGRNGTGKTTISDAFHWLMLGKNSQDSKDFEIKPISKDGKRSEKLDNEVSAIIEVDGELISLRKVNSEKWQKPKGQLELEFKGNETNCFWNEVPEKVGVFQEKINAIIPEDKLKLFTNTSYFNSMKWSDRRAVLVNMAGDIDRKAIIDSNKDFAFINDVISQGKTLADFKKENAAKRKKAKDELDLIPARADEVKKSIANLERPFERLRSELSIKKSDLSKIDQAINDRNEAYKQDEEKINEKRRNKFDLNSKASTIANSIRSRIAESANKPNEQLVALEKSVSDNQVKVKTLTGEISHLATRITNGKTSITTTEKQIEDLNAKVDECRKRWNDENEKVLVFAPEEFCCPTCKRGYEPDDVVSRQETMKTNFVTDQANKKAEVVKESNIYKEKIKTLQSDLSTYTVGVTNLENEKYEKEQTLFNIEKSISEDSAKINEIKSTPAAEVKSIDELLAEELKIHKEYNDLLKGIEDLEQETSQFKPVDNTELIKQKEALQAAIDELNADLLNETQIKAAANRLQELSDREKILAQEIADMERKEYFMMQFTIEQMNEVENRVNNMFEIVKFRMFDRQVDGQIYEVCDTLVDGKPIHGDAVNTASVVNAGLDIINTLSREYGVYAPVFIDGRESVTELIHSESQVINLVVSPQHDKLTVEANSMEAA